MNGQVTGSAWIVDPGHTQTLLVHHAKLNKWVQPGGHRGPLRERFVRQAGPEGDSVRMQVLDSTPWPAVEQAVPVEVAAGTLVCFHGLLPHWSAPNRSSKSRHAYTLHAVDASSLWAPSNWMRRRADLPLRGFA